jgi:carbamoyltransferase
MTIFGINETSHDAGLAIVKNGEILFAAHSERYSKKKNDWFLNKNIIYDAFTYDIPSIISYYEKPFLKRLRLLMYGGLGGEEPFFKTKKSCLRKIKFVNFKHHYSHACAGYYTSKFNNAVIVVLDSIGEFNTSSIWIGEKNKIKNIYNQNYPISFGLFYSAFTQLLGLEPNKEEYILMGMASYGNPEKYYKLVNSYFPSINKQKYNFHKGIYDWGILNVEDKFDIAAAVQKVYEKRMIEFMHFAYKKTKKKNLVFMGGCALNCTANTLLWNIFDDIWIMPNPGDAGNSLGAAAALYGEHLNWKSPYLGHNLNDVYPIDNILKDLLEKKISAVAVGRAEFGPRALGNRSILADPRDPNIKDKVNEIKQREKFRPFAPVIMEEYSRDWFDMKFTSPYMQYAVKCKNPDLIPSVVHVDGTSRVQTVNETQHKGLYNLLKRWNDITGIPILLNTSLNIKNQPLLNDSLDIEIWEKNYNYNINV